MTQETAGYWHLPEADPAALIKALPTLGKLMLIHQQGGVTHERIGPVDAVEEADDRLHLRGACHDSTLSPARVERVMLDTTAVMKGKTYPRLDFLDTEGQSLFAVAGMEDLPPFEVALTDLARSPAEKPAAPARGEPPELAEDDPGLVLLRALCDQGAQVEIGASRPGLSQRWQGRIESVKPSMGFINVMTADFHLHLRADTVADWQLVGQSHVARDAQGAELGLVICPK